MDFVSLGDASQYESLGESCAAALRAEEWDWRGCYSTIRPIGISLYYAIPNLLGNDELEVRYITLFMNIAMLAIMYASLLLILRTLPAYACSAPRIRLAARYVLLVGVLIACIPFIPVRLSDHQSLALFLAAIAVLSVSDFNPSLRTCLLSGLIAGCAVLLKQNYVVATAAFMVIWFSGLTVKRARWTQLMAFTLGFSIIGIQLWATWQSSGIPWFYEPAAVGQYAVATRQPVVELIAYTDPIHSAYLSSLDRTVSAIDYLAVKFYHGAMSFYWSVYLGEAPLEQVPVVLAYDESDFLLFDLIFAGFLVAALVCWRLRNQNLTILVWTAMAFTCFGVVSAHTEYRYFLFFRLAFMLYFVALSCHIASLSQHWLQKNRVKTGVETGDSA